LFVLLCVARKNKKKKVTATLLLSPSSFSCGAVLQQLNISKKVTATAIVAFFVLFWSYTVAQRRKQW
jgi:hypothetical protein